MTDHTCPLCDRPIEEIERVDDVTYALQPCGHQVDDRTRADLSTVDDEDSRTDD